MQSTPPPPGESRRSFALLCHPNQLRLPEQLRAPGWDILPARGHYRGGKDTQQPLSPASLWCSAIPAGDAGSAPRRCWTMQFGIQLKRLSVVPNKLCTAYILQHFTPSGSLFSNRFPPLFMLFQIKLLIIRAKIKNERTLSEENWFSFFLNRAIARFYILCSWRSLVIQFSFY